MFSDEKGRLICKSIFRTNEIRSVEELVAYAGVYWYIFGCVEPSKPLHYGKSKVASTWKKIRSGDSVS